MALQAHGVKVAHGEGSFLFWVQGARGVQPMQPLIQADAIRFEFRAPDGHLYSYAFSTFAQFFDAIAPFQVRARVLEDAEDAP